MTINSTRATEEIHRHERWLREIGQLRPDNHDLWKYLQRRVLDPIPLQQIAEELGVDADALVAWMLAYRGPKRKPYQSKAGPPISSVTTDAGERATHADARRFAAWRKSTAGAIKARTGQ